MIFVDSGYPIALIRADDELHDVACLWSRQPLGRLLMTEYVILETLNTLSAATTRVRAAQLIDRMTQHARCEVLPIDDELRRAGMDLYRDRPDKEWSLTDCVSFIVMERRGIERALTYDRHFEQAGFDALLRREPA